MNEKCSSCKFWNLLPSDNGECLRRSPTHIPSIALGGFPIMEPERWCGDFERRKKPNTPLELEPSKHPSMKCPECKGIFDLEQNDLVRGVTVCNLCKCVFNLLVHHGNVVAVTKDPDLSPAPEQGGEQTTQFGGISSGVLEETCLKCMGRGSIGKSKVVGDLMLSPEICSECNGSGKIPVASVELDSLTPEEKTK